MPIVIAVSRRRGPVRPDAANVVRGQVTRRRILDIARKRILASGFEALRLDDLARDAGVTKAAVVKSVGGKSSMLLMLADEDRQSRLAVIEAMRKSRTGLERRLTETVRRLLKLDHARLNLVVAFIGYYWFWDGEDRNRAQAMVDDTRARLCDLIVEASASRPSPQRLETISRRLTAGYAVGLRDLCHRRASPDEAVRFIVRFALD
jgi:AcrR family transcriptional regulator